MNIFILMIYFENKMTSKAQDVQTFEREVKKNR